MTEKNAFANLLDAIVQQKREKEQDSVANMDNVSGTLPLPATQDIHPDYLEWKWEDGAVPVIAVYSKPEEDYYIIVNGVTIDSDQAKALGEILLSASRWRDIWQINAGLYLAHDGRLQASPDKGPDDGPDQTFQC